MSYNLQMRKRDGYLLFTVTGTLESAEDLTAYSNDIEKHARQADVRHVLLDMREVSRRVDQHDCATYANKWSQDHPNIWLKVAAVYTAADAQRFKWVETIYKNRSINYKIFDDMEKAEHWLMSSDSPG